MRHVFASSVPAGPVHGRSDPVSRSCPPPQKCPIANLCSCRNLVMTGHSETDRHARMMQALHAFGKSQRKGDPATPPIVSSVKFNLPGDPEAPFVYGRYGTPTLEATEAALGALEGAPVIGFPSGMAAVTAALFLPSSRAIAFCCHRTGTLPCAL